MCLDYVTCINQFCASVVIGKTNKLSNELLHTHTKFESYTQVTLSGYTPHVNTIE